MGTRFCVALALLAGLGVPAAACWFWRFGYTADTAMLGLMAQSILERGERPLFGWALGHQGMLQAYATAFLFKWLGPGPRVLNIFSAGCFVVAQGVLFAHVRRLLNARVAALTVVFFAVSTPAMVTTALRPTANAAETYLLGLLLLLIAQHAVQRFYVKRATWAARDWVGLSAAGLVAGFALYTSPDIDVFFVAIALQGGLMLARGRGASPSPPPAADRVPAGARGGTLWRVFAGVSAFAAAFAVGYAPALAHRFWLHGDAAVRVRGLPNWHDLTLRLGQLAGDVLALLNVDAARPATWLCGIGMVAAVAWFLADVVWRARTFVDGSTERAAVVRLDPLFLLPLAAVPLFLLHGPPPGPATDPLVVLWMVIAVALAWTLVPLAARSRYGRVLILSLLVMNGLALVEPLDAAEGAGFLGEEAVGPLQARGIRHGYADDGLAYPLSFYTREQLVLQPVHTPYCPFYGPMVEVQERVALVERASNLQTVRRVYRFGSRTFRPVEVWHGQRVGFVVLQADEGVGPSARR